MPHRIRELVSTGLLATAPACTHPGEPRPVTFDEVTALPVPPADHRVAYGSGPLQFGELRLPEGPGPHPVAVVVHGGCWRAQYTLDYVRAMSEALTRSGIATWSLEYRRIGDSGGGWPGTFQDVARGTDHLRELAEAHALDLRRVVTVGHSAGGHLALWLAARHRLPPESPLHSPDPLPVAGVVSLAGITDLRAYGALTGSCPSAVPELMGAPAELPERYAHGSPAELLPLGVPVVLVQGGADPTVPRSQAETFAARARERGDDARVRVLEWAGHFDVVAPTSPAWPAVEEAVRLLARR